VTANENPFVMGESANTTPSEAATGTQSAIHRAGWVVTDPDTILENGFVTVSDGRIESVGTGRPPAGTPVFDHGDGILLPALVNAHTHLELSALSNRVPWKRGFQSWVVELLRRREALEPDAVIAGAAEGLNELLATGCRGVGDISTLGITGDLLLSAPIDGIWFHEFLGDSEIIKPDSAKSRTGLHPSLAGHAPHTTAPDRLQEIKATTRKISLPMSIHLGESEDEMEFITTGSGPWAEFLTQRGIDFTDWPLPAESPVVYLQKLGILDADTVSVHLIHLSDTDLDILRQSQAKICLCPRSNWNLHGRRADLGKILAAGIKPCLGTDSLASVSSLSLFDEMAFTARAYPDVGPKAIFTMATENGAAALGLANRLGKLQPGYWGAAAYIPARPAARRSIWEAIVHHETGQNDPR